MKKNFDNGYQLPKELCEIMDLASEMNARINRLVTTERTRLTDNGWFRHSELGQQMSDLMLCCDHVDLTMQTLSDYASMLIKTEMTEKWEAT